MRWYIVAMMMALFFAACVSEPEGEWDGPWWVPPKPQEIDVAPSRDFEDPKEEPEGPEGQPWGLLFIDFVGPDEVVTAAPGGRVDFGGWDFQFLSPSPAWELEVVIDRFAVITPMRVSDMQDRFYLGNEVSFVEDCVLEREDGSEFFGNTDQTGDVIDFVDGARIRHLENFTAHLRCTVVSEEWTMPLDMAVDNPPNPNDPLGFAARLVQRRGGELVDLDAYFEVVWRGNNNFPYPERYVELPCESR